MKNDLMDGMNFTGDAWELLYDVVDNRQFQDKDAEMIFAMLSKKLRFHSFGDYLKRYIYQRADLTLPFDEVPIKEYQMIIKSSFQENYTPASFEPTTAKLSALSKNWLTQQTVKRKVVFLLGFGLSMSLTDVNEFLQKGLREQGINAKDPFEVICWYCYKNGYGFPKFESLWNLYLEIEPRTLDLYMLYENATIGVRNDAERISSDAGLLQFVSRLKCEDNKTLMSVSVRQCFDELFQRAKELVAECYNRYEENEHQRAVEKYEERLLWDENIKESEVRSRVGKKREQKRVYKAGDITESDLENMISSAIPKDRHGNLTPGKLSNLNEQFDGKRFSRQHISDILAEKAEANRFDLITLLFFIYSQTLESYANKEARFSAFLDEINTILERCFLGDLYIANPYECFVLMCILADDPLGTYADVWELSYGQ